MSQPEEQPLPHYKNSQQDSSSNKHLSEQKRLKLSSHTHTLYN